MVSDRLAPPLPWQDALGWISLGLDEVGASGELACCAGFLSADSATELQEQSYKQRSTQRPPRLAGKRTSLCPGGLQHHISCMRLMFLRQSTRKKSVMIIYTHLSSLSKCVHLFFLFQKLLNKAWHNEFMLK